MSTSTLSEEKKYQSTTNARNKRFILQTNSSFQQCEQTFLLRNELYLGTLHNLQRRGGGGQKFASASEKLTSPLPKNYDPPSVNRKKVIPV